MRAVVVSVVFNSECTGVIPLPALKAITSSSPPVRQKTPAGLVTSTVSPSASRSSRKFDTTPPSVRLTVTCSSGSTAGEEDME